MESRTSEHISFSQNVDLMVDRAMKILDLDDGMARAIKPCNSVLHVRFPVKVKGKITSENAARIHTKLIAEAANGPITFEADEILKRRGITILPDTYVNAGGVIVSYFEWIRNLSHVRFGRMERRYDELRSHQFAEMLEEVTGTSISDRLRKKVVYGAAEIDLVRSGLDDAMREAYQELREQLLSHGGERPANCRNRTPTGSRLRSLPRGNRWECLQSAHTALDVTFGIRVA